jgi:hypothetical protein
MWDESRIRYNGYAISCFLNLFPGKTLHVDILKPHKASIFTIVSQDVAKMYLFQFLSIIASQQE